MTPQEFISYLLREVLEQNLALYRQNLEPSASSDIRRDTHWPRMAELYQSLTDEQRQQFIDAIRQVMVDTMSNILGILDGSTLLENHRDYFHLTYGNDPKELNGELQDLFISHVT